MPEEARKGFPSPGTGTTGSYELAMWMLTAESGSSACALDCWAELSGQSTNLKLWFLHRKLKMYAKLLSVLSVLYAGGPEKGFLRKLLKTSYRATVRVSGTLRQKTEWPVHRQKTRWGTLKYMATMGELRWFSPIPLDLYRWVFKRLVIPFGRVPASH